LRAAGLRSASQMLVTSSTPWSSIVSFCSLPQCAPPSKPRSSSISTLPSNGTIQSNPTNDSSAQFRVVIKPVRSSGGDGVTCCTHYDEVKHTLSLLLGRSNKLGSINNEVVMQEYLDGVEHVLDSVSSNGIHKTLAVWYETLTISTNRYVVTIIDCQLM
jgi:biotin carboxylase